MDHKKAKNQLKWTKGSSLSIYTIIKALRPLAKYRSPFLIFKINFTLDKTVI